MITQKPSKAAEFFNRFSNLVIRGTGSPLAFLLALVILIVWALTGPIFKFSDTWQLVINTGTSLVTFLMVFIIQQSQNKDTTAIQLKLNELIACNKTASNRLIAIEDLTQEELDVLKRFYTELSVLAESESDIHTSHSIDEAKSLHQSKHHPTLGKEKKI